MGTTERFLVPFKNRDKETISAEVQAKQILDRVQALHKEGKQSIGLTYSANAGETRRIAEAYQDKNFDTGVSGANQGKVIPEIAKLLKTPAYQHLQQVFRIIPITTMAYTTIGTKIAATDKEVGDSLTAATDFVTKGGHLIGWINQDTPNTEVAIGGGVAREVQTDIQKRRIKEWTQNIFFSTPAHQHKKAKATKPKSSAPAAKKPTSPAPNFFKPHQPQTGMRSSLDALYLQLSRASEKIPDATQVNFDDLNEDCKQFEKHIGEDEAQSDSKAKLAAMKRVLTHLGTDTTKKTKNYDSYSLTTQKAPKQTKASPASTALRTSTPKSDAQLNDDLALTHTVSLEGKTLGGFTEARDKKRDKVKMTVTKFPHDGDDKEKVTYAMAIVTKLVASLKERPSATKQIQLNSDDPTELAFIYTALRFAGSNLPKGMQFGPEAINLQGPENITLDKPDLFQQPEMNLNQLLDDMIYIRQREADFKCVVDRFKAELQAMSSPESVSGHTHKGPLV
jgi:hypothetical protein